MRRAAVVSLVENSVGFGETLPVNSILSSSFLARFRDDAFDDLKQAASAFLKGLI